MAAPPCTAPDLDVVTAQPFAQNAVHIIDRTGNFPAVRSFTTGGGGAWAGQPVVWDLGNDAARSGTVADGESSWIEVAATGPVMGSFAWKVSSEAGHDYLTFTVDGIVLVKYVNGAPVELRISGEQEWKSLSTPPGYWFGITCSRDGSRAFAVQGGSGMGRIFALQFPPRLKLIPVQGRITASWVAWFSPVARSGCARRPPSWPRRRR